MAGPYQASHASNYVGVGVEVSRGTSVAPTFFAAYIPSVDLDHQQALNRIMEAGASGQVTYAEKVSHLPTGKFVVLGRPSTLGKLYAWLLGADAAGSGTSAKTLSAATTTSSVATFTTTTNHNFVSGDTVVVAGVTPAGYNGTWVVASTPTGTTFTANIGTTPADGSVFGTAARTGSFQHVLTDDFVTDYLSIEQFLSADLVERFQDGVVAEIVLSCDIDNPSLRATCTWMSGKPGVQGSPTSTSYETENPFLISQGTWAVDGNTVTNVRKFTLTTRVRYSMERVNNPWAEWAVKVGEEVSLDLEQFCTDIAQEYRLTHYGSTGGTAPLVTPTSGSFAATFVNAAGGTGARRIVFTVDNLDYDQAQYTPLDPGGNEGTKVTRASQARRGSGSSLLKVSTRTGDSAAYV